jgi:hypothetical protein
MSITVPRPALVAACASGQLPADLSGTGVHHYAVGLDTVTVRVVDKPGPPPTTSLSLSGFRLSSVAAFRRKLAARLTVDLSAASPQRDRDLGSLQLPELLAHYRALRS